ncbi:MAG: hypothetical protein R6T96_14070, partial [Longimicrobiales bacterium]
MFKRIVPASALFLFLALAPTSSRGQVTTSLTLGVGLFDGVGIGMTSTHWAPHSMYRPGFRAGFGAAVHAGIGVGFGVSFGHGSRYSRRPHRYDAFAYGSGHDCWYCWDAGYVDYDPYCSFAWGCYDPYYPGYPGAWGPYYSGGLHISLGLGWRYYRRPAYFDPWWGHTGYLARWRPVWGHDPGWWYYNDPWYVSPGYARV